MNNKKFISKELTLELQILKLEMKVETRTQLQVEWVRGKKKW
jgi:hypothetical protein